MDSVLTICTPRALGAIQFSPNLHANENDSKIVSNENSNSHMMTIFKVCTVLRSVSTQKLLQLAYNLLHEAATGSESCAYQMFYAVRSMFELFCIVVLTFHKQELQNLPQVAGKSNTRSNDSKWTFYVLCTF